MNHCEMIWRTAGTNRVCSRCMELKDSVVGRTDESGVQIPPLHPRCRCTIEYREKGGGGEDKPKPPKETKPTAEEIRAKLEATKTELKLKGEIIYPPPKLDISNFVFDAAHTQGDKHPHDVTEKEARKFIAEAYFALSLPKIDSLNFFGAQGAAYVRPNQKKIRTAFKREEYNSKILALVEVYENEIGS